MQSLAIKDALAIKEAYLSNKLAARDIITNFESAYIIIIIANYINFNRT